MWSGHSCPLPLLLVLFLVFDSKPQGERNREGHDSSRAASARQRGNRLQPLRGTLLQHDETELLARNETIANEGLIEGRIDRILG